ncbi:epimerase [Parabacteroides merdae]|uniref:Epimerase n=1 Tax=Parabacteroides merdae TaxID=46503 RepID=A0A3R6HTS1_9BACT|nr:epimerase [Parabacteroides merdae]RHC83327.1 epimerase [Parabacteroides merdae]RHI71031.1 epimerase [Parabacteroides merdae]RHL26258.1 epimerase [Parabacteroides merdae]RHM06666.1 epimerase [Parabacteroides merdae]
MQKFYDYITKKTAELFAVCQRMHIFAAVITTKVMRTIIVNTYWWWRSLQLIRS